MAPSAGTSSPHEVSQPDNILISGSWAFLICSASVFTSADPARDRREVRLSTAWRWCGASPWRRRCWPRSADPVWPTPRRTGTPCCARGVRANCHRSHRRRRGRRSAAAEAATAAVCRTRDRLLFMVQLLVRAATARRRVSDWLYRAVMTSVVDGFGRRPDPRSGDVHEFWQAPRFLPGQHRDVPAKVLVMPQMSKVELYAAIRRDHRDGMTMRELERKYNVPGGRYARRLNSSWPEPRKSCRRDRRRWTRTRRPSTGSCGRTWTRRASSGTRSRGSSTGWSRSTAPRCRIPWSGAMSPTGSLDPGGVGQSAAGGVRPADPPARHGGGGRLRRRDRAPGRRAGDLLPVLLPAVVLGQGRPPRLRLLRPGSLLRRPRARAADAGRCPAEPRSATTT